MVQESVDQGPVEITRGGMDDHSCGLVDDDQMFVLKDDVQIEVLRLVMGGGGGGDTDLIGAARNRLDGGIAGEAGRAGHVARADQGLQSLTRQGRDGHGERAVEPPAIGIQGDRDVYDRLPPGHSVVDVAMKWAISRPLSERLLSEAKSAGRREICGLLIGGEGRIDDALPVRNIAPDPERAFLLDPAEHLRRSREARVAGRRVVGCYHSHPSGDARPSATDGAGAFEAGFHWLILGGGKAALWRRSGDGAGRHGFAPIPLEID